MSHMKLCQIMVSLHMCVPRPTNLYFFLQNLKIIQASCIWLQFLVEMSVPVILAAAVPPVLMGILVLHVFVQVGQLVTHVNVS